MNDKTVRFDDKTIRTILSMSYLRKKNRYNLVSGEQRNPEPVLFGGALFPNNSDHLLEYGKASNEARLDAEWNARLASSSASAMTNMAVMGVPVPSPVHYLYSVPDYGTGTQY